MISRLRTRFWLLAVAVLLSAPHALARQSAPAAAAPAQTATLTATIPTDPQITRRHAAERARATTSAPTRSRRSAPSCGSSSTPARCSRTTISAGSRTSSSTWRSTARSTSRSRTSSRSCSRSACGSAPHVNAYTSFDETVYQLQIPTDNPARHRPVAPDPRGLGAQRRRSIRPRSTRSAASSSRNGGSAAAPTRACRTRSCPSCSRARATPSGCRSASRRSSRTPSPSG